MGLQRSTDAVKAIERALEIDPKALDRPDDGNFAAQLAADQGRYDLAQGVLERVVSRLPPTEQRRALYVLYGDVSMARGAEQLDRAVAAYREALRQGQRGERRAALGLALALQRSGESLEARDLARAVAAEGAVDNLLASLPLPEPEKAARRALIHGASGEHTEAIEAWRKAAADGPWKSHAQAQLDQAQRATRRGRRRTRRGSAR